MSDSISLLYYAIKKIMKLQSWMKVLKSIGFKHCMDRQFPQLADPHYMNGWLEALGMMHGYKNILPLIADDNYFDGYEQAQEERRTNGEPDIREVLW